MEVKSIFVDSIMNIYKSSDTSKGYINKEGNISNTIAISPKGSRRLFKEILEEGLKKGLREGKLNENK